jgi:hypothetical protein
VRNNRSFFLIVIIVRNLGAANGYRWRGTELLVFAGPWVLVIGFFLVGFGVIFIGKLEQPTAEHREQKDQ